MLPAVGSSNSTARQNICSSDDGLCGRCLFYLLLRAGVFTRSFEARVYQKGSFISIIAPARTMAPSVLQKPGKSAVLYRREAATARAQWEWPLSELRWCVFVVIVVILPRRYDERCDARARFCTFRAHAQRKDSWYEGAENTLASLFFPSSIRSKTYRKWLRNWALSPSTLLASFTTSRRYKILG